MSVDKTEELRYTESDLQRIIQTTVQAVLAGLPQQNAQAQLGNYIQPSDIGVSESEGETNMASKMKRTYNYINANGENDSVIIRGASNKDIDIKFQEFLSQQMQQRYSAKHVPTLTQFVDTIYRDSFISNLKPTTQKNYNYYLQAYVLPCLGHMKLDVITVHTIQSFYDWMANASKHGKKKNLNYKTIERISGLLGKIFRVAKEMKLIDDSPIKKTLLSNRGEPAGHHEALPDDVIARVKQQIPTLIDPDHRLYMALLAYTGMRREEILGLRWEDINFEQQYLTVSRAVTYPNGNEPHVDTPKSKKSARTVLLVTPAVEVIKTCPIGEGFIFGGSEPWYYTRFAKLQRKAFSLLGITNYCNHDFRATFGTQLKESGMTSAQVADLLGHADTRMVETVYARTRHDGVMKQLTTLERLNSICTAQAPDSLTS